MKSPVNLAGQHALITGAGRGIGATIAGQLAEQGVKLTLLARTREQLERRAEELRGLTEVHCEIADVSSLTSVNAAVASAIEHFGPVTILVNNAGQALGAPLSKMDPDAWQRMIDINLNGSYHCIRAVLPEMHEAGWGRIINVASTAGLKGYAYTAAYCASKHGVIGLTRALALELVQKNITVNAVCPGFTETDLVAESIVKIQSTTGRNEKQARQEITKFNPQGRLVQPIEVASAVLWLCQPASGSITGQAISVSGGEVM